MQIHKLNMNTSAIISGIIVAIIGALMIILGIFNFVQGGFVACIFGLIFFIVGIYMIFNSEKENEIEQVKTARNKKESRLK